MRESKTGQIRDCITYENAEEKGFIEKAVKKSNAQLKNGAKLTRAAFIKNAAMEAAAKINKV